MGVPISEVGYTPAMPRREDHEVHKDMWDIGPSPPQKKNSTGGMDVCLLWVFLLSVRGLCDELITRPEESYRLWCVVVCDLENLMNEEP